MNVMQQHSWWSNEHFKTYQNQLGFLVMFKVNTKVMYYLKKNNTNKNAFVQTK